MHKYTIIFFLIRVVIVSFTDYSYFTTVLREISGRTSYPEKLRVEPATR